MTWLSIDTYVSAVSILTYLDAWCEWICSCFSVSLLSRQALVAPTACCTLWMLSHCKMCVSSLCSQRTASLTLHSHKTQNFLQQQWVCTAYLCTAHTSKMSHETGLYIDSLLPRTWTTAWLCTSCKRGKEEEKYGVTWGNKDPTTSQ